MILVIGQRVEGHLVVSLAIQTHLSCRNLLAVGAIGEFERERIRERINAGPSWSDPLKVVQIC
jgi:hypothetical protein